VPNSTIVFVGNKIDLRGGKNIGESVSYEKAKNLIDSECHCSYYECSALTQSGLKEVFESAAAIAIAKKRGKLPH
jgi:GTPase SAR1 family protein